MGMLTKNVAQNVSFRLVSHAVNDFKYSSVSCQSVNSTAVLVF